MVIFSHWAHFSINWLSLQQIPEETSPSCVQVVASKEWFTKQKIKQAVCTQQPFGSLVLDLEKWCSGCGRGAQRADVEDMLSRMTAEDGRNICYIYRFHFANEEAHPTGKCSNLQVVVFFSPKEHWCHKQPVTQISLAYWPRPEIFRLHTCSCPHCPACIIDVRAFDHTN